MKTKLGGNKRLIEHMIPDFGVGCRRPTPGNGYLEALNEPNVRVITDEIESIAEEGIVLSTGELLDVDVIICATGFDISFAPRFPLIGRGGVSLADHWKDVPEAYLSLAVEHFPNYFSELVITDGHIHTNEISISILGSQFSSWPWFSHPLGRTCSQIYHQCSEKVSNERNSLNFSKW